MHTNECLRQKRAGDTLELIHPRMGALAPKRST